MSFFTLFSLVYFLVLTPKHRGRTFRVITAVDSKPTCVPTSSFVYKPTTRTYSSKNLQLKRTAFAFGRIDALVSPSPYSSAPITNNPKPLTTSFAYYFKSVICVLKSSHLNLLYLSLAFFVFPSLIHLFWCFWTLIWCIFF